MFTSIEDAIQTYSDVYKDANGFRPCFDTSTWTLHDFNLSAASLQVTIEENIRYENERSAEAVEEMKQAIQKCIEMGAKDERESVRWLLQADNITSNYEVESWMWKNGIAFTPYEQYLNAMISFS